MEQKEFKRKFSIILVLCIIFTMLPINESHALEERMIPIALNSFGINTIQANGGAYVHPTYSSDPMSLAGSSQGSAFLRNSISLNSDKSFSTYFKMRMAPYTPMSSSTNYEGGMSFVIQTNGNTEVSSSSVHSDLGYYGINNSIAVAFDYYNNKIFIYKNGNMTPLAEIDKTLQNGSSEAIHYAWVDYNGTDLEIRINSSNVRPASADLTYTIDLSDSILNSNDVYAGFTAAYYNKKIDDFYFNNNYDPILPDQYTYVSKSYPVDADDIVVINNENGTPDSITIKNLYHGSVINVYDAETEGNLLGSTSYDGPYETDDVSISVDQLGITSGNIWVTATSNYIGLLESDSVMKNYSSEPRYAMIAPDESMIEEGLDDRSIIVTLSNETFVDSTLNPYNFTLSNLPSGVTVENVNYTDATHCSIDLAYDGTDFDSDIARINVTIAGEELTGDQLISNDLSITAIVETAPTVTTVDAANVTTTTADIGGNVSDDGGESVTERGVVYSSSTMNPSIYSSKITNGTGTGTYMCSLTGLTPNKTYYARAYAINSEGTSYGDVVSFTTEPKTVTITADESLTEENLDDRVITAVLDGDRYGATLFKSGFTLNNAPSGVTIEKLSYTSTTCWIYLSYDETDFDSDIANLSITIAGDQFNTMGSEALTSNALSITATVETTPTVTTVDASNVTLTSAEVGGNISDDGGESVTERGVVYATSTNPTTADSKITGGSGTGTYTSSLTGLTLGTTYYVRAYAINSVGTSYGDEVSFTTELPTVTITADESMTEENLDERMITALLDGDTYVATLDKSQFTLNNAPSGVTIESVDYTSTTCDIYLAYDGTDFDNDIANLNITVAADQLTGNKVLTSNDLGITATTEATPTVATVDASNVTLISADVGGNISDDGGEAVTERGVVYGVSINPTTADSKITNDSGTGTYTSSLTGLMPGTTYYARAYAINSVGTSYGDEVLFMTLNDTDAPQVTSQIPSKNTNVDINTSISIIFNEDIYVGDNFNSITLKKGTVAEAVYSQIQDNELIIYLNNQLDYSTNYTVEIPSGSVKDYLGNEFTNIYSFSFTTKIAPDINGPYITATNPINNAVNVPVNKTIEITFSEDIFAGAKIGFMTLKKENTVMNYVYEINGNELTINPNNNLDYGAFYTLTIPEQTVTDTVYNSIENQYILNFTTESILSDNAKLSGLTLSNGDLTPVFNANKTSYTANVSNNINDITITPAADENARISVNGTEIGSGEASESISLNVSNNTIKIIVTAEDGITTKTYTITVTREASNSSSDRGSKRNRNNLSFSQQNDINIILNGKQETTATETIKEENGQKQVEVKVSTKVINKQIEKIINEQLNLNAEDRETLNNTLKIPVKTSDIVKLTTVLTGDVVKKMEENIFELSIASDELEYIIPAKEIGISKVAEKIGISEDSLDDIEIEVQIQKLDKNKVAEITERANVKNYKILFPPVEFKVVAKTTKSKGELKSTEISGFTNYVERVMEIPKEVDPSIITTGIVYNSDGTFSHIPTTVFEKDGKWFAKLNSLTNSSYSVISSPITVTSVETHWSREYVNDMASRLIIKNPESFTPDGEITRAEFAEYITKALGIYRTGVAKESKFTDVNLENEFSDAITIAVNYGIINGYPDGSFKPEAKITREEAMVMYAKAIDIAKLKEVDTNQINTYKDKDKVSPWAYSFVKKTVSTNVFNGRTKDMIVPLGTFTYAEAATAIRNLLTEAGLINR